MESFQLRGCKSLRGSVQPCGVGCLRTFDSDRCDRRGQWHRCFSLNDSFFRWSSESTSPKKHPDLIKSCKRNTASLAFDDVQLNCTLYTPSPQTGPATQHQSSVHPTVSAITSEHGLCLTPRIYSSMDLAPGELDMQRVQLPPIWGISLDEPPKTILSVLLSHKLGIWKA